MQSKKYSGFRKAMKNVPLEEREEFANFYGFNVQGQPKPVLNQNPKPKTHWSNFKFEPGKYQPKIVFIPPVMKTDNGPKELKLSIPFPRGIVRVAAGMSSALMTQFNNVNLPKTKAGIYIAIIKKLSKFCDAGNLAIEKVKKQEFYVLTTAFHVANLFGEFDLFDFSFRYRNKVLGVCRFIILAVYEKSCSQLTQYGQIKDVEVYEYLKHAFLEGDDIIIPEDPSIRSASRYKSIKAFKESEDHLVHYEKRWYRIQPKFEEMKHYGTFFMANYYYRAMKPFVHVKVYDDRNPEIWKAKYYEDTVIHSPNYLFFSMFAKYYNFEHEGYLFTQQDLSEFIDDLLKFNSDYVDPFPRAIKTSTKNFDEKGSKVQLATVDFRNENVKSYCPLDEYDLAAANVANFVVPPDLLNYEYQCDSRVEIVRELLNVTLPHYKSHHIK